MSGNYSAYDWPPSAGTALADGNAFHVSVLVISSLLTPVVLGIYVSQVTYVIRHLWECPSRNYVLCLLAAHPIYACLALLGIVFPRSSVLVDLVGSMYLAVYLTCFVHLLVIYFGGTQQMIERLGRDVTLPLRGPPCCCCCRCLPDMPITPKVLIWINVTVMQVALIRPVLMLISAVMWTDGLYVQGESGIDNPYFYISTMSNVSTLFAIYGLIMVYRLARVPLQNYWITAKLLNLKFLMLCTDAQGNLLSTLAKTGVIAGVPPFSSVDLARRINHFVIIIEMVLLSGLATWSYRHEQADSIDDDVDHEKLLTQKTTYIDIADEEKNLLPKSKTDCSSAKNNTMISNGVNDKIYYGTNSTHDLMQVISRNNDQKLE